MNNGKKDRWLKILPEACDEIYEEQGNFVLAFKSQDSSLELDSIVEKLKL